MNLFSLKIMNKTVSLLLNSSITAFSILIGMSAFSSAQAISFLSTRTGQVGTINTATGVFTPLANNDSRWFTDIALDSKSNLFGVTFSNLYKIDDVGQSTLIGRLGKFFSQCFGFYKS